MRSLWYSTVLIVTALFVMVPPARAELILTIKDSSGGPSFSYNDLSTPGTITLPGAGVLVDGVTFKGGATTPPAPGATFGSINLALGITGTQKPGSTILYTLEETSTPAGPLTVTKASIVTPPPAPNPMYFFGNFLNIAGTVNGQSAGSLPTLGKTAGLYSASAQGSVTPASPADLKLSGQITSFSLNAVTGNHVEFTNSLTAVPEPTGVLLGLLSLPLLGAVVYFARRPSAALAAAV
jgi:hypothetical protein